MQAVREAAESGDIGEFLGYGQAGHIEQGGVSVSIRRPDGTTVAGFQTPLEFAKEFANDRLADYRNALGEDLEVFVEPAPTTESSTSATTETETETPATVESAPPEIYQIGENLQIEVSTRGDGRVAVRKTNTETGRDIPMKGAEDGFASTLEALDFLSSRVTTNEDGVILSEAESIESARQAQGETHPLMLLLHTNPIRPTQADIGQIGRVARREARGFRGITRDTASRGGLSRHPAAAGLHRRGPR